MPVVYLIRHGETDWNAARRIQGQIDIPLNRNGRAQAERNGMVLRQLTGGFDAIDFLSSTLSRASETMEIVRRAIGLPPQGYRADARLMELHYGDWQGLFADNIRRAYPEVNEARRRDPWAVPPPGAHAESFAMLAARVLPCMDELQRDAVIVSHGGISRLLRAHILRLPRPDILRLDVPQDKILRIEGQSLTWH